MKKLFFSLIVVLFANVALAQEKAPSSGGDSGSGSTSFTIGYFTYTVIDATNHYVSVKAKTGVTNFPQHVVIPGTVTHGGQNYTVTMLGSMDAGVTNGYCFFKGLGQYYDINSIVLPNTMTHVGNGVFYGVNPQTVVFGTGITEIGQDIFNGGSVREIVFLSDNQPDFISCNSSKAPPSGDEPGGATNCSFKQLTRQLPSFAGGGYPTIELSVPDVEAYSDIIAEFSNNNLTLNVTYTSAPNVENANFEDASTWGVTSIQGTKRTFRILEGHQVTLNSELILDENTTLINEGVLRIAQDGELINNTNETDLGVIEVEAVSNGEAKWTLIGAPFTDYSLNAVVETESDIAVSLFDYENGQWSSEWATIEDNVSRAESFFAWPFGNESIIFNLGLAGEDVKLNFDNFSLNKSAVQGNNGYWLPLANPYTFKLDISKFLTDNANIQGGVSYRYNGVNWTVAESGVINVTEGFFVNFVNAGSQTAYFNTTQRHTPSSKANTEREFVRLAMLEGERSVELLFAQNDDANESYDIYDANKLFSPAEIAEPYFLTDGIALVKEEVNTLPYYATMNVRSYEGKEVKFKADYIPEGLSVSIIDGEEIVDLTEGAEYTTEIASGENADRFKVLVKKNVGLADVEELDVRITNSNRHITITAQEDVKVTVYNTLGQRVFETEKTDFVLSGVASGAYVVKVQGAKAAKSQKIIVE